MIHPLLITSQYNLLICLSEPHFFFQREIVSVSKCKKECERFEKAKGLIQRFRASIICRE